MTCFVLSIIISLAVFVFSPKPTDTSDRCATSDQRNAVTSQPKPAGKQLSPRRNQVGLQANKKRGGNRASSPAPELQQKHPNSALLFPGGAFEARSPFQVNCYPPQAFARHWTCLICWTALLLWLHRIQSQIFTFYLAPRQP